MGNTASETSDVPRVRGGGASRSSTRPQKKNHPSYDGDYSADDSESDSESRRQPRDDDDNFEEVSEGASAPPRSVQSIKCMQKRDLEQPKRPLTPFNCFIKARLAEGGKGRKQGGDMAHRMGSLASEWKAMPDNEKIPYVFAANVDRQRHAKEKAKYESDKGEIIKRPLNGYIIFMKEFRKQQKGNYKDAKELVREGAKAWKRLKDDQKTVYNQHSLGDSDRYARERFHHCNKVVWPRKGDTRFSGEAPGKMDEPREMDTSDEKELQEWLKKSNPMPSSSPSRTPKQEDP